jgi:diacylglycerol O-acyltransferase / wax synthase
MTDQLTALEATFLELEEADESAHMHIGALMVFEPAPYPRAHRLDAVRRHLERRLDALPRYRRRLSEQHTGGLSWPEWDPDERFEIENHVHRAALPAPGGERELLDWLGQYWSQRLDRSRPLWEVVVLEGLANGRWGLATKTHHGLVDGVGSVDAAYLLLDTSRRPPSRARPAPAGPPLQPEHHGFLRRVPDAVAGGARAAVDVALHPGKALERGAALAELIVRDEVVPAPETSINVPIGTRRRYAAVRADLGELKAVKRELGGTINDVVLAATAGGLRRLLLSRSEEAPSQGLRAMVPVNVRAASEHLELGNKVTSLFVHLPVAEPDPLRRYRLTMAEAEELKHGNQATGGATLIALAGSAPPVLHSFLARSLFASRLFNVTVTNVSGPQQPLYAFGSRMEEVLPLVPLAADHAVGIAIVSYDGKVFFGLNGDDRAAADLHVLRGGIEQSLAELRDLARVTTELTA